MIVDAAARGKQIFCEKPIDLSLEKVQAVNEEVSRRGVRMMVGFNRRFDPNFLKVRETIAAGLVGQPHILRITSRDPGPPPEVYIRASGGIFLDMTIHDFDMARYLMGSEVTEVYTRAAVLVDPMIGKAGDWDTAVITLTFENGAFAMIDNSRKAVYGYDQRVEMFGSGGMVTVANNTPDTHILCDHAGIHTALPLQLFPGAVHRILCPRDAGFCRCRGESQAGSRRVERTDSRPRRLLWLPGNPPGKTGR